MSLWKRGKTPAGGLPGSKRGRRPLSRRKQFQRLAVLAAFAAFVALTTPRLQPKSDVLPYDIEGDTHARETIIAEWNFRTEDLNETRKARETAAREVPDTYRADTGPVVEQLANLDTRITALAGHREGVYESIREALLDSDPAADESDVVVEAVQGYVERVGAEDSFARMTDPAALTLWLMPTTESIPVRQLSEAVLEGAQPEVLGLAEPEEYPLQFAYAGALEKATREAVEFVLSYGVLDPERHAQRLAATETRKVLVLRETRVADMSVREEIADLEALTPTQAAARLRTLLRSTNLDLETVSPAPVAREELEAAVFAFAAPHLMNTLVFDPVATEGAREAARAAVEPVTLEFHKWETIQEAGAPWTAQSRAAVMTYFQKLNEGQEPAVSWVATIIAHMIFVGLALTVLVRTIPLWTQQRRDVFPNLMLALLLMAGVLVMGRVAAYFEESGLVVPVAASAILMAILVSGRFGALVGCLTAGLLTVQYNYDWRLLAVSTAMVLTGVFGIYKVRRRGDMTRAAVMATGIGLVMVIAVTLATGSIFSEAAWKNLVLIALNGAACLFLVPGLLSPLERLFGVTTDIQLLEYSDLNNRVLSRLAIEVPATYAHSLMLGQLAEAACDAIGANGLLARVCALYHDIGKLRRPEYFSENQTGENIHDELPPRLSARAIASHVSQGVDMAKECHLPTPIIDGIMEHHGTTLVGFFYQEACAQDKHGDVREEDFRYPGPRPQSRETAILMICDGAESGVRSIKNPNEERVREMIGKIVDQRSADRQFDECALTLKDLDVIKDVVTKRVMTTLHSRIAYPDKAPAKEEKSNVIPMAGGRE
jgi:putative nucleotidyltransferase with HDIG domain